MSRTVERPFASLAQATAFAREIAQHRAALVPGVEDVALGEAVTLRVTIEGGAPLLVSATALQVLPGLGFAAAFDDAALASVGAWVEGGGASADAGDVELPEGPPGADDLTMPAEEEQTAEAQRVRRPGYVPDKAASEEDLASRYRKMTQAEKIQAALHGSREMRGIIARDSNRALHQYLLKNGHVGLDEVQMFARITSFSTDALVQIARHDTWGKDQTVCTNLARNPRLPLPLVVALLDKVPRAELRRMAQGVGVRDAIKAAAASRLSKLK